MTRVGLLLVSALATVALAPARATELADLPRPAEILGSDPCAEGVVVDSRQVDLYLQAVARATPRVRLETLGLSVEGRPIRCVYVSEVEHLVALGSGPPPDLRCALVTCGVHPAEVGSTPAGLELIHWLASGASPEAASITRACVVIIVPAMNPDGTDLVATWLRAGGADYGGGLPFLQHRYAGHDLNRDWMLASQPEVLAIVRSVQNLRRPELTIDLHQMGPLGPRIFVPPYAEPVDPSIDRTLLQRLDRLGNSVFDRLVESGRTGVSRRWTYDAWTPARAYPFYHGGMRFLIEAASGRYAQSIQIDESSLHVFGGGNHATGDHPAPWKGGRWGLPEASDYLGAAARACLASFASDGGSSARASAPGSSSPLLDAATERVLLSAPRGDPWALEQVVRALEVGGATAERAPGGWLLSDPPWGKGWCRALLVCTPYTMPPDARNGAPYDTTTHDLAHLAGLRAERLTGDSQKLGASQAPVAGDALPAADASGPWVVRAASLSIFGEILDFADGGDLPGRLTSSVVLRGERFDAGDFVLPTKEAFAAARLSRSGHRAASAGTEPLPVASSPYPAVELVSGSPCLDEGWLRWVLEEHRFPFRSVDPGDVGPRPSSRRRVLLVPDQPETAARGEDLRAAVVSGARVIAFGDAAADLVRSASLPLEEAEGISTIYGAILRTHQPESVQKDPMFWGLPNPPDVFCLGGAFWRARAETQAETLLAVDATSPRVCGLLSEEQERRVAGTAVLVRVREGNRGGEWILFGSSPHFRGWSLGTFRLLFNAILAP